MAHATSAGRPVRHRLGLLLTCCALLLVAAGCGGDDSVFTTNPDGSGTQTTLPGGLVGPGDQGGPDDQGSGSNPGGSAAVFPGDAQVYAGLDLNAFADLQALVRAFEFADPGALTEGLGAAAGDAIEGADQAVEDVAAAQNLLTCLTDSLGIGTAGLPAWMGGEAALGLFNMALDPASGEMSDPNALVAVAVDDQAGAGSALPGIITAVGTCAGVTFTESADQGITVYGATPADGGAPISIALTEGYLMYAEGAGMVERAIDLGDGASLADDDAFNEVVAALPNGRHVTGYMAAGLIQEAVGSLAASAAEGGELPLPTSLDPTQMLVGVRGLGMSATMLEEGVRLEMVTVGEPNEALPTGVMTAGDMAELLPADALGFAGIGAFDVSAAWGSLMDVLAQMPVEEGQPGVADTITMLGTMLGVDIETDLVGQMTGEIGVGLLPATVGSLAASGVNLGFIAVLGVRDPGAMAATATALAEGIARMSQAAASPRVYEGGTLYALSDGTSDIALFGMAGDHMVITSHESHAAALLAGGAKLAGSARYGDAIAGLPGGGTPLMYLDIAALVAALGAEADAAGAVAPLQTVAASVSRDGDIGRMTVFARIDY